MSKFDDENDLPEELQSLWNDLESKREEFKRACEERDKAYRELKSARALAHIGDATVDQALQAQIDTTKRYLEAKFDLESKRKQ